MATNTQHVATVKKFQADVAAAVRWKHPDYNNSGITRERARRLAEARKTLAAAVPPKTERKGEDPRGGVIAGLAPKTADEIAQVQHAWSKIEKRLDAGQSLHTLLTSADRVTLAAILDGLPTRRDVLESSESDSIIAEVQQVAFRRLVEIGDEAAVSAQAQTAILDQADAWSEFMAASAKGEPTLAQHSALQQSDPEGYAAIQSASADGVETSERVRTLDHMVQSGSLRLDG